jgi:hypothetical protein
LTGSRNQIRNLSIGGRDKSGDIYSANVPRQVSPAKKCSQPECQLAGAKGAELTESVGRPGISWTSLLGQYLFFFFVGLGIVALSIYLCALGHTWAILLGPIGILIGGKNFPQED